ncbi:alpha/beta hydrolase [Actinocatenispora sera]|uniref:alpha/beta hydrolase n=1 Tax=Actinocatenispora sera TaxID=390989 RepID=UPI0033C527B9
MPPGFITTMALFVLLVALAWRPPRPRRSTPWSTVAMMTYLLNEQPFAALVVLTAAALPFLAGGTAGAPLWWLGLTLTAVPAAGMVALAVRTRTARPVLAAALDAAFGAPSRHRHTRMSWPRLLVPFVSYRPGVRRLRNLRYGAAPGRGQLLDVYLARRRPANAPVLVYLHGGGFAVGDKLLGGRPLLYRLASRGWVCVSANYRLRHVGYADRLGDVERVLAWVREHAAEYGADPSTVVLAGGSAGAHLAMMTALTGGRPPSGSGSAGTSVAAVIGLYGYYGSAGTLGSAAAAPAGWLRPDAPPALLVHGTLDTMVLVEDARAFAAELRRVSTRPVAYAELPGTQHNFDFFSSLRFHAVLDAVEDFLDRALPGRSPAEPA